MSVSMRQEADTGFVEIDNPPVNAIGHAVREGLLKAVKWAEEAKLARVIVTGKGRAFAAGADAREFDSAPKEPHLPDVLNAIDESPVPWIAAIDGVALGGGAEIAMACRMRIISPKSQIGLPEVTLGVLPGAGGTQRLPRLVGLARALDIITTGKPLTAQKALEAGLVHQVADDPMQAALGTGAEALQRIVPTWTLPAPDADEGAFEAARKAVAKKQANQTAPLKVIELIRDTLAEPFHQALLAERTAFLELRNGAQSKALRHMFFAERAAKAPAWLTAEPVSLKHVAVVGGGTMGAGIAYALLNAGLTVTILETDAQGAERAIANVEKIISASLKRGLINDARAADHRSRFAASSDYSTAADATLAIEAAYESMEVKVDVIGKLEAALPKDAILATNTSYLDINEIAAAASDPARVVGLHFFAPAHIMKLLEIVRGDHSSDTSLATGFALAKLLRKIPVLAGVCDGFIGNRILARYREAADTVLMDGATPWDVDKAMVGFGYAMGPYEAQDLSGLDIAHANRRRQDATRDANRRYIPIADRMVELGRLGKKTGAGWYLYPETGGKAEDAAVAELAVAAAKSAGLTRTAYSQQEIERRLVLAMINEAADILDEGIAQSAADIDLVTVSGYGFPRWRGGLMHYADSLGAGNIVEALEGLALEDAVAWKVSPLLKRCAENGGLLADYVPTR